MLNQLSSSPFSLVPQSLEPSATLLSSVSSLVSVSLEHFLQVPQVGGGLLPKGREEGRRKEPNRWGTCGILGNQLLQTC